MQTGFHHAFHHRTRNKVKTKTSQRLKKTIDAYAYLMGFITVAVNVPQLINVWTLPDVSGVSVLSWIGFMLGSLFWLSYGLLHKAKALVVMNGMLIIVQGLIVFRLLFH